MKTIGGKLVIAYKELDDIIQCFDFHDPIHQKLFVVIEDIFKVYHKIPRKMINYVPKGANNDRRLF